MTSPGQRFLDVGSGSGALSLVAARKGDETVAVDIAPTMIERLLDRARAEGLDLVSGAVMDGRALDFEDDSFDVAASQNGVTMVPAGPGLAEMVRVTRPGGKVLEVFAAGLAAAGLTDISVRAAFWDMPISTGAELWETIVSSNPIGGQLVAGLSPDQRSSVLATLDGILQKRVQSGQTGLRSQLNIGLGTV